METKKLLDDEMRIAKGALNANRPAFPSDFNYGDEDFTGMPVIVHKTSFGLTKREYFAGLALSVYSQHTSYYSGNPETLAKAAVELADALLAHLSIDK